MPYLADFVQSAHGPPDARRLSPAGSRSSCIDMDERPMRGVRTVDAQPAYARSEVTPIGHLVNQIRQPLGVTAVNLPIAVEVVHLSVAGGVINKNVSRSAPDMPTVAAVPDGGVIPGRAIAAHDNKTLGRM